MTLGSTSIEVATTDDMVGCKVLESKSHIGLFNYNNGYSRYLFTAIVVSKRWLHRTRLLRIRTRKFGVDLYNYCKKPKVSFFKSQLTYGVYFLFVKIVWHRF